MESRKLSALCLLGFMSFILVISFLFTPEGLPSLELCLFKKMTGLPCPGCGLTRSFCAISHGQFAKAWEFNPFGPFFYLSALAALLFSALIYFRPSLGEVIFPYTHCLTKAICFLVPVLYIYGIWRIIASFP